jgi:hypothetical protein
MKKVYFAPQTEILEYMTEEMIAASGVTGEGEEGFDLGIGFGGIDDPSKDLDPESRIPFGNFIFGE